MSGEQDWAVFWWCLVVYLVARWQGYAEGRRDERRAYRGEPRPYVPTQRGGYPAGPTPPGGLRPPPPSVTRAPDAPGGER